MKKKSNHRFLRIPKWLFGRRRRGREYVELRLLGLRIKLLTRYKPPRHVYRGLPIEPGKIVVSEFSSGYSGHGKYIVEEIRRRGLPWKIVWCDRGLNKILLANRNSFPDGLKVVVRGTDEADYEYETAQVWLDSVWRTDLFVRGITKKPGQTYIQLGHGSIGIKKISLSVDSFNYKRDFQCSEEEVDYKLSNSTFETKWWGRTTGRYGEVLQIGHPRNDILFRNDTQSIREKVCEQLGIPTTSKIVLYAPTWRPCWGGDWNIPEYSQILQALEKRFGGKWVVAARMHYIFRGLREKKLQTDDKLIINATSYADVQELFVASDVMITDYSSAIFEYVQTRKPGFLFVPDRHHYNGKLGLEYPLEKTPFPIAVSNEELERNILQFDEESYRVKVARFLEEKGSIDDGYATKRFVDFLEKIVRGGAMNE